MPTKGSLGSMGGLMCLLQSFMASQDTIYTVRGREKHHPHETSSYSPGFNHWGWMLAAEVGGRAGALEIDS